MKDIIIPKYYDNKANSKLLPVLAEIRPELIS